MQNHIPCYAFPGVDLPTVLLNKGICRSHLSRIHWELRLLPLRIAGLRVYKVYTGPADVGRVFHLEY